MSLVKKIRDLRKEYGQGKPMLGAESSPKKPHYFLLRKYLNENDLLVILNTKRCRYQCHFCQLSDRSSTSWIPGDDILSQFEYVLSEMRHSLDIIERITLSNEGSMLDATTLQGEVLLTIAKCTRQLRRMRTLVIESRVEFITIPVIEHLQKINPKITINILTGFETLNSFIRDNILGKREPLEIFLQGLDKIAETGIGITSFVLYKPSQTMSDADAFIEAEKSIDYVVMNCQERNIPLTIRLNPMHMAIGSKWAQIAQNTPNYQPPKLTDVMKLAEKKAQEGVQIYIGLSNEGLNKDGRSYMAREDYSSRLIEQVLLFNDGKISTFEW